MKKTLWWSMAGVCFLIGVGFLLVGVIALVALFIWYFFNGTLGYSPSITASQILLLFAFWPIRKAMLFSEAQAKSQPVTQ